MTTGGLVDAIVPAKGTSLRIPFKNAQKINGDSLVVRKIKQLLGADRVQRIFLATDSEQLAEEGQELGAEILWREPEFADDKNGKSLSQTIEHLASQVDSQDLYWAQVTSPFLSSERINFFVNEYFRFRSEGFDSLISQLELREFFWENRKPMNYVIGGGHPRSQDLAPIAQMTFGVLMAPRMSMVEWGYYHGPSPAIVYVDKLEALDIDDEEDLRIARAIALFHES